MRRVFLGRMGVAAGVVCLLHSAAWLWSGWQATGDVWPTPIDDAYIHAVYAKNLARGHLFTWSVPDGYSKGATTPLFPLLLAPGWLVGFRGHWIMAWAWMVNTVCIWGAFCLLLDALSRRVPAWFAFLAAAPILTNGSAVWGMFGGMEIGPAMLGNVAVAWTFDRVWTDGPTTRRLWGHVLGGALAVVSRPESCLVYGALTSLLILRNLVALRWWIPALVFLPAVPFALYLGLNLFMTGDPWPNSAPIKSIRNIPYMTFEQKVDLYGDQWRAIPGALLKISFGAHDLPSRGATLLILAGMLGVLRRELRPLVIIALVTIAITWHFQASQRIAIGGKVGRYFSPYFPQMLLLAAVPVMLGGLRLPRARAAGLAAAALLLFASMAGWEAARTDFVKESRRIREHQIAIAHRLLDIAAEQGRPIRFITHEGGAPIYFTDFPAIDIIGLCWQHPTYPLLEAHLQDVRMPFESLEGHWPEADLPEYTVMFRIHWGGLPYAGEMLYDPSQDDGAIGVGSENLVLSRFPRERVGSGHPLPAEAASEGWELVDRLDVADLLSERAHDFQLGPLAGVPPFEVTPLHEAPGNPPMTDMGRGLRTAMSFTLKGLRAGAPVRVWMRYMVRGDAEISVKVNGVPAPVRLSGAGATAIGQLFELAAAPGDTLDVVLPATMPCPVIAHIWVVQPVRE